MDTWEQVVKYDFLWFLLKEYNFYLLLQECDRLHYRNSSDKSISTSGSCHMCPCQVHVESCRLDPYGRIEYVCTTGYTGFECKEREGGPQPRPGYPGELIFINPPQVSDNEGAVVKLTCQSRQADQPFTYVWFKDNRGIQMGNHIFAYENILIIRSATVEDSGEYRCEAGFNDNVYTSTAIVNINGAVSRG